MKVFENDTFLKQDLEKLIEQKNVLSVIETGTEYGGSAVAFSEMKPVKLVVSMDIQKKFNEEEVLPKVQFLLGDSRINLWPALLQVKAESLFPVLIFLDAHTSNPVDVCPLKEELAVIAKFFNANEFVPKPIIVIHDCLVPDRSFGYDVYADGPISWELLKDSIEAVYPAGCVKRYNEVATGSARGCLFVVPV